MTKRWFDLLATLVFGFILWLGISYIGEVYNPERIWAVIIAYIIIALALRRFFYGDKN